MCNIHVMRTWDAFMAQDPASKREAACAAVSWNYQPNCQHNRDSERSNPEQGSICSHIIIYIILYIYIYCIYIYVYIYIILYIQPFTSFYSFGILASPILMNDLAWSTNSRGPWQIWVDRVLRAYPLLTLLGGIALPAGFSVAGPAAHPAMMWCRYIYILYTFA